MKFYSIHYRIEDAVSTQALAEHMTLVRDGFSWGAFFLTPLWLLVRGMWIALAISFAFYALAIGLTAMGYLPDAICVTLLFGLALFMGFEGNDLYRWTLARRRMHLRGYVAGDSRDSAAQRWFNAYIADGEPGL